MEESLKSIMDDGEQLLWRSRPEPFETLDKTHKKSVIVKSIITAVVTVAIITAYIIAAVRSSADMKVGLIVIILVIGGYMIASPFLHARKLRKKAEYAITTRQLVLITDDAKGTPYDKIGVAAIRTDDDGHSSLLCGEDAIKAPAVRWRGYSMSGAHTNVDTGRCDALVFYAIPEAERVREILKPYLTLN